MRSMVRVHSVMVLAKAARTKELAAARKKATAVLTRAQQNTAGVVDAAEHANEKFLFFIFLFRILLFRLWRF